MDRQDRYIKSFNKNNRNEIEIKKKATRIENGNQIPDSMLNDKEMYYKIVWKFTNINKSKVKNINLRGINYHLDHKYSIKQGFMNNIPPYLIGSIKNLEIITTSINCSKQDKCSININELF